MKLCNNTRGTHFNSLIDDQDVNYFNILSNDEDKHQYVNPINNKDTQFIPSKTPYRIKE